MHETSTSSGCSETSQHARSLPNIHTFCARKTGVTDAALLLLLQAHDGYSELSHRPVMVDVLLEQPVLVEFYWRMWPQVFAAAPGSPPDNRWPKKGAAAAASKASPARSRLLLPVLVAAAAVGAGVWFALNR